MALKPKPFQSAAIEAAVRAFEDEAGSRRFLVADEVGLGKTVVAAGIVERLSAGRLRPLSVFYVCSNALLARQNLGRLASFLPEQERDAALATVDRPSLMPASTMPSHNRLHLYSLSPATAVARGGGRVEERAFAAALLERILPRRPDGLHRALRLGASSDTFKNWFKWYRRKIAERDIAAGGFAGRFRIVLRGLLKLADGQHLPNEIEKRLEDGRALASTLRSALAIAALSDIRPDLVIFDEFQKFRDLLDPEDEDRDGAEAQILKAIKGDGDIAVLLLSATPYVPYRTKDEAVDDASVADFYSLVGFLAGDQKSAAVRQQVASSLADLSEELRKGVPDPTKAVGLKTKLEEVLRPLMCRTERQRAVIESNPPESMCVDLVPADVDSFAAFTGAIRERNAQWAVPLWSSVPLPLQTLGPRYQAWREADWSGGRKGVRLTKQDRDGLTPLTLVPNPRLRSLLRAHPTRNLALPWVAPSRPWWPLGDVWRQTGDAVDGKSLIFSRYRAAPSSIAGMLSYSVETAHRPRSERDSAYEAASRRQLLRADPKRPGVLALFHPSPLLAGLDPLSEGARSGLALRQSMYRQLIRRLAPLGIKISSRGPRARPTWQLLAALEHRLDLWVGMHAAWRDVAGAVVAARSAELDAGDRLGGVIDQWEEASRTDVSELDDEEVRALARLALEAPGVVFARALRRHWPAMGCEGTATLVDFCWFSLRSYFDNPLFAARLGGGRDTHYPEALQQAIVEGNLESVLDEHFWYVGQSDESSWPEKLEKLGSAMRLRNGSMSLFEGPGPDNRFSLRCHAALAMNEVRSTGSDVRQEGEAQVRPDEVRRAFNTPFWPHVLTTTSVGQEGLDFHPWCRSIVHWDPPSGPVALEQREGRVTRHAGLNVRRALAVWAGELDISAGQSPWIVIARKAEQELTDATGLRPWWTADGKASIRRLVLAAHGSEIEETMRRVGRERALYRMVIGMPDQADLMDFLVATDGESIDPENVYIDLAAMRREGVRH
jgi:hypothetical protein